MENTPIFPLKIINKFSKYTNKIKNEYFKPSQINKEIISIQSYMEKFNNIDNININIKGTNIDNYIEQNQHNIIQSNIDDTKTNTNCCLFNICSICKSKTNINTDIDTQHIDDLNKIIFDKN